MTNDTRRRLEEAGGRTVDGPDPAFAEGLEARLLAVAASRPAGPRLPPLPQRRRSRRLGAFLVVAGLAVAGLAVVLVLRSPQPAQQQASEGAELVAPVNVEVRLADGTTIDNPDGLLLPDGAVVRVGAGGSARVGDVELQPGDVVTVAHGEMHVEHGSVAYVPTPFSPASVAPASPRPTAPGPATTTAPATSPPAAGASPTPGNGGPTPRPTPTAPAAVATPGQATPTPSPAAIIAPRLVARLLAGNAISVTWTRTRGARTYVLVMTRSRTGTAPRPTYPGSRILAEFAHPPATPLRFQVAPAVVQVKLMVVALDRNGVEIARSRVVRVQLVVPASPAASG